MINCLKRAFPGHLHEERKRTKLDFLLTCRNLAIKHIALKFGQLAY